MRGKFAILALALTLVGCREEEAEGSCAERLFEELKQPEYVNMEDARFSNIVQTVLSILKSNNLNACDFGLLNGRLVNRFGQPVNTEWDQH